MKKLFISCPMRKRSEEDIRKTFDKLHRIAEAVFDKELEVIPTYFEGNPPANVNEALWYLGESIKKLSEADYFIGIFDEAREFRGCIIENIAAKNYGIPFYLVNLGNAAPDVIERRKIDISSARVGPWSNAQPVSAHVANGGSKETARFIFLMCNLGG